MAIPYYEDKNNNVKKTEATPMAEVPKVQKPKTTESPKDFYQDYMDKKHQTEYNNVSTYPITFNFIIIKQLSLLLTLFILRKRPLIKSRTTTIR